MYMSNKTLEYFLLKHKKEGKENKCLYAFFVKKTKQNKNQKKNKKKTQRSTFAKLVGEIVFAYLSDRQSLQGI